MINLVIAGAAGRMGSRIIELANASPSMFKVAYGLDPKSNLTLSETFVSQLSERGTDVGRIASGDVVIDFTVAEATLEIAAKVAEYKKAYVIGTTGFSPGQERKLKDILKDVPVVKSPNMSLGVNVLFKIAAEASRALSNYSVKIEETHHLNKKDRPSGTALQIKQIIEDAGGQGVDIKDDRKGDVVGEHKVIFSGPADRLELFHHADSRDTFAAGALHAAKWIVGKKPGFYDMQDILGLKA